MITDLKAAPLMWNGAKINRFSLFCTGHCVVSVSALRGLASKYGAGFSRVNALLTGITSSDVLLEGLIADEPRRSSIHSN